ncbi:helix-turn-helix domain-containing protein [Hymenobacter sp. PAMC 26628]|uniref:helix-turn-helix domain-containing protein n=1 Tax=Hymenobacter sp. PAMC 26628 TaxID=1484118 RepID=UPI0009020241
MKIRFSLLTTGSPFREAYSQGIRQLAAFFAVRYATVHEWLRAWQGQGLAGLLEGKRTGRPPKLPAVA